MSERLSDRALRKLIAVAAALPESGSAGGVHAARYEIVREVGRGGMGIVYEAEDLELGRRVALKLLALPPGAGDGVRERFVREARAAARLSHPGIAAVYDADEDAIAMQFVDGVALSVFPRDDRRLLVQLVRDAALAVHYAHEQGIVHRDLKPHNLLVERGRAIVTDFGLAKDMAVDTQLSLSGHVLGTPAYMSPEQAEGRVHDIDARTDVYGLGATLYDLLAGRPPFVDRDVVRLLRAVQDDEPRPIHAFQRDVPRDLERVVLKCLAKEPERRYATARELALDLDRWLEGRPVLAQPPSLGYRLSKFARRRKALLTLGALVAAALVVALFATQSEQAQRRASLESLALAQLVSSVQSDAEMHRRLGEVELANERLGEGVAACRAFLVRHEVGLARCLLGRLLRAQGQTEQARRELDLALELDPALVEARLERGLLLAAEVAGAAARAQPRIPLDAPERMDSAVAAMREIALGDLREVDARPGSLRSVDVEHARGELAHLSGDLAGARKRFGEVLRLDPLHSGAKVALSQVELAEGNGDAAWALAMSAVDLYRGFGPAYLAQSAASNALQRTGEPDAVERAVRQHAFAAANQRVESGDRSPDAYQMRGATRLSIDDVDGALADLGAALREEPNDATAYGNRGLVHTRRAAKLGAEGASEAALAEWKLAIDDYAAALKLDPLLAGASNNLAVCCTERERVFSALGREGEAATERARAERELGAAIDAHPRFGLAYLNRAMVRRRNAEALARALRLEPASAAIQVARADVDRALELKPDDPAALVERALLSELAAKIEGASGEDALAQESARAARTDLDAAVAEAPREPRPRGLRGLLRMRAGDREGAVEDIEAALALAPDARLSQELGRELARMRAELAESPPSARAR